MTVVNAQGKADEFPYFCESIWPTGSLFICNPPVTDTDVDFLCLLKDRTEVGINKAVAALCRDGFTCESQQYNEKSCKPGAGFMSWRKGKTNYIVTANPVWAAKHNMATAICKKLNLLKKEDRILVFRAILYDEVPNVSC